MMCYRGDKVTKAFDELIGRFDDITSDDVITQHGYYQKSAKKCACCGQETENRITISLCDKHISKYGDIVKHE